MLEGLEIAGVLISVVGMGAMVLFAMWTALYLIVYGWPD